MKFSIKDFFSKCDQIRSSVDGYLLFWLFSETAYFILLKKIFAKI